MKLYPTQSLAALAALLALASPLSAATGEVTLSGSTWTGKVDGVTKYTGASLGAAANTCITNMSSGGTLQIKNSGTTTATIGIVSNTTVDGFHTTLTSNGTTGAIRARNKSTVGVKNVVFAGSDYFGAYFQTNNGQTFSGIEGGTGITLRIDNCSGGAGYSLSLASPTLSAGGDNGVETYGISGVTWSTVTATDRGACGLLLNQSSSASGTTVNGTRCNYGGGYAGFRVANSNKSTTLSTVTANNCGRGFFSVSNSEGATVNRVNATSCSSHGVWLQSTKNSKVNGGTITSCNPCSAISQDLGGNTVVVTCR